MNYLHDSKLADVTKPRVVERIEASGISIIDGNFHVRTNVKILVALGTEQQRSWRTIEGMVRSTRCRGGFLETFSEPQTGSSFHLFVDVWSIPHKEDVHATDETLIQP